MEIVSNGSKFAGETPDSVEELIKVLKRETLDPTFERYGGVTQHDRKTDSYRVHGNFRTVSHVFDIHGTYEELKDLLQAVREARSKAAMDCAAEDCQTAGGLGPWR